MEKEKLFLYQLYAALYRNGCKKIDISMESLRKLLPYLKCTLDNTDIKDIEALFIVDEEGVYSNYLKANSEMDPLFVSRENNEVNFIMNREMSDFFNDENVNYIGAKMAAYIKIKEKVKVMYENN